MRTQKIRKQRYHTLLRILENYSFLAQFPSNYFPVEKRSVEQGEPEKYPELHTEI